MGLWRRRVSHPTGHRRLWTRPATWPTAAGPFLGRRVPPLFGDFLQAFVCARSHSRTILAVVSGLVLAASAAISDDVYTNIIKGGKAEQSQQIRAARITSAIVGAAVGVAIAFLAEKQNVGAFGRPSFRRVGAGVLPAVVLHCSGRK